MTYRMHRALIAPLSAAALLLAANPSSGGSAVPHGTSFASAHPAFRPFAARSLHHHRRSNLGAFWPGEPFYEPPNSEPNIDAAPPPASSDVHYTYTYDVPWDAVHRFPPNVTPSARPYVQECTARTVTVPRHEGSDQTANVNIMRCY